MLAPFKIALCDFIVTDFPQYYGVGPLIAFEQAKLNATFKTQKGKKIPTTLTFSNSEAIAKHRQGLRHLKSYAKFHVNLIIKIIFVTFV
jgi:hypothetical protein